MREVQAGVQLGGDPDLAGFAPAMVAIGGGAIGRLIQVFKIEGGGFQQMVLGAFHREVVVGAARVHQIPRQLALREQGIGADGLAADRDGV